MIYFCGLILKRGHLFQHEWRWKRLKESEKGRGCKKNWGEVRVPGRWGRKEKEERQKCGGRWRGKGRQGYNQVGCMKLLTCHLPPQFY